MPSPLRLAIVLPRHEPVTTVGVEVMARELARRLPERGHRVDILTTCVQDDFIWRNHYHPGLHEEEGLSVRRFPVDSGLITNRALRCAERIEGGADLPGGEQRLWLAGRGASLELTEYLARSRSRYDCFVFTPALNAITLDGVAAVGSMSLVLPALSDLPEARTEAAREIFRLAAGALAASEWERDFLLERFALRPSQVFLAGAAVDPGAAGRPERFRERYGIRRPFLAFGGRRLRGKRLDRLLGYAALLARTEGVDCSVVCLGTERLYVPSGAGEVTVDLGFVEDGDRYDCFAAALAVCQPSAREGLGLTSLEAWAAGRPVLAFAGASAVRRRCAESGGGLWFENYPEFAEGVRLLLGEEGLADGLGARGRVFARERHSWPAVLDRFEEACRFVSEGRGGEG